MSVIEGEVSQWCVHRSHWRTGSSRPDRYSSWLELSIGLALLRAIGRSSAARRRHGWFVLGWMLAGFLIGGAYGVCLIDNNVYYPGEADFGMAWFGMLLGWVVGIIHGGVVLAFWPRKTLDPTPPGDMLP